MKVYNYNSSSDISLQDTLKRWIATMGMLCRSSAAPFKMHGTVQRDCFGNWLWAWASRNLPAQEGL
jgi:hypothetical protein